MRDGALGKGGLDGIVHDIIDMGRTHDALAIGGDIRVKFVEIQVLLKVSADQVVKDVAGNRQHGCAVGPGK